jgi:peroxiredoxin
MALAMSGTTWLSLKGRRLLLGLLFVGVYGLLQYLASLPKAPTMAPEAPQTRKKFRADFTLPDLHGQHISLSEFRGRVVLVNFWATWCYPCRAEMPSMEALYQDYKNKGFTILAISSDIHGYDMVAPFVAEYTLTFPILLDPQNMVGTQLQVRGIPMSYLLDKQGRIAGMELGAKNWQSPKVRHLIDQLLRESS